MHIEDFLWQIIVQHDWPSHGEDDFETHHLENVCAQHLAMVMAKARFYPVCVLLPILGQKNASDFKCVVLLLFKLLSAQTLEVPKSSN